VGGSATSGVSKVVEPHPYRFNGGQSTLLTNLTLMQQSEKNLFAQSAVCRGSKGLIIKAISQINPLCDPNYGEALAALLASSLAVSLQLKHSIIERDFLVVIMALQHPSIVKD
jgi:hypothetical protein